MAADEIHVGDIGTQFTVTIKDGTTAVDVSSATTQQLIFKRCDGSVITRTSTFVTDGTDGQIKYTTVSGDLSVVGTYKLQANLVLTGWSGKTDITDFDVHCNLA